MRMRQSLAQFEEAFREEAAESIVRASGSARSPHSAPECAASSAPQAGLVPLRFLTLAIVDTRSS
jgi:hypothetical protein